MTVRVGIIMDPIAQIAFKKDSSLAMLLAAGVPYGRWLRFAIPGALCVSLLGLIAMTLAG